MQWRRLLLMTTLGCLVASLCRAEVEEEEIRKWRRRSVCDCKYKCGTPNREPRVVGGKSTKTTEYPWLAALKYRGKLYCGGSLVNDQYIVTAAHCIHQINKNRVEILLGSHNQTDTTEAARQTFTVSDWWAHPSFNRRTFNNDIGVIQLDRPVKLSQSVRPVCLPAEVRSYVGEQGIVPGWGRVAEKGDPSDVLREVKVPVMSNEECKTKNYKPEEITDNMMCAGYDQGKIDACQGDSGGPLLYETRNTASQIQLDLIGIVSWGQGCAQPNFPGIYTRISNYMTFIESKTENGCFCARS